MPPHRPPTRRSSCVIGWTAPFVLAAAESAHR
jgi:hypothetical protein